MTSTIDKIRVGKERDRRIKIPASEHEYIKRRYKEGESLRGIARDYKADKRWLEYWKQFIDHIAQG